MPTRRSATRAGLTRPLSRTSARGVLTGLCAALASTAMLVLSGAGIAFAGEWVQASCINPNQTAAGSAGWSSFASGGGSGSKNSTGCGSGIAHASTRANGTFTVPAAPGPSRLIIVDYRAFSTDAVYTAQTGVQETVAAGVSLQINSRQMSSTRRIVLSGTVHGPIPPQGVLVEMLVHYRGHWEPLRDPRTSRSGRFRMTYEFEGAVGRVPFRAEVLGGQAGFPYASGDSAPVSVATI
jgi:hypothetical protein